MSIRITLQRTILACVILLLCEAHAVYDAELGRWLSADPIEEGGGLNLYRYVGNGPVGAWDPLGLVDKSYTPGWDPKQQSMREWEKTYNPKDKTTVAGHGDPDTMGKKMMDPTGRTTMSPEDVAKDIANLPNRKKGTSVELIVCNSGLGGKDSFAQKFAQALANLEKMPITVKAPNHNIHPGNAPGEPPIPFIGGQMLPFSAKPQ